MFARLLSLFLIPLLASAETTLYKDALLLRFTSFGLAGDGSQFALRGGELTGDAFVIPNNGFSPPLESPGKSRSLELGTPGTSEAIPFKPLATVQLPEEGRRFLVIVFPVPRGLRATVIRADDPAFRRGDVMIFNLSTQLLAADLGGQRMRFPPGSTTSFRPRRQGDAPTYQVSFYSQHDGKPKMFAANMWPYFDHKRAFVFLFNDPANGRPTYRSVDEFTEWLGNDAG